MTQHRGTQTHISHTSVKHFHCYISTDSLQTAWTQAFSFLSQCAMPNNPCLLLIMWKPINNTGLRSLPSSERLFFCVRCAYVLVWSVFFCTSCFSSCCSVKTLPAVWLCPNTWCCWVENWVATVTAFISAVITNRKLSTLPRFSQPMPQTFTC